MLRSSFSQLAERLTFSAQVEQVEPKQPRELRARGEFVQAENPEFRRQLPLAELGLITPGSLQETCSRAAVERVGRPCLLATRVQKDPMRRLLSLGASWRGRP